MATLWVLIANRGFAKIYEVQGHGRHIKEVRHIDNPDGRKKSGEFLNERPGRLHDRIGTGRHSVGTAVDPVEQELRVFTHKLATILQEAKESKAYDDLALVAPAHFLGDLNKDLSVNVKKSIVKEVPKDLPERLSEEERVEQLRHYLDLWNDAKSKT